MTIASKLKVDQRAEGVTMVPIGQVKASPDNPRKHFDQAALDELAASIKEIGLLEPLIVTPGEEGYDLVAGERRQARCPAPPARRPPGWSGPGSLSERHFGVLVDAGYTPNKADRKFVPRKRGAKAAEAGEPAEPTISSPESATGSDGGEAVSGVELPEATPAAQPAVPGSPASASTWSFPQACRDCGLAEVDGVTFVEITDAGMTWAQRLAFASLIACFVCIALLLASMRVTG